MINNNKIQRCKKTRFNCKYKYYIVSSYDNYYYDNNYNIYINKNYDNKNTYNNNNHK